MGAYAKMIAALATYVAGAVPVVVTYHTWQQIVAYLIPGVASVLAVYFVPNQALPVKAGEGDVQKTGV